MDQKTLAGPNQMGPVRVSVMKGEIDSMNDMIDFKLTEGLVVERLWRS